MRAAAVLLALLAPALASAQVPHHPARLPRPAASSRVAPLTTTGACVYGARGVDAATFSLYRFDEASGDALDSAGGRTLVDSGSGVVAGRFGNARRFYANASSGSPAQSTSYLINQSTGWATWAAQNDWTIEFWFRSNWATTTTTSYTLAFLGVGRIGSNFGHNLVRVGSSSKGLEAGWNSSTAAQGVRQTSSTAGHTINTNGAWQYVAIVKRAGALEFYLNGVRTLNDTGTIGAVISPATDQVLRVGTYRNGISAADIVNGAAIELDELRFSSTAISAATIATTYAGCGVR